MPTTPRDLVYPDSGGSAELWEHLQNLAESADTAIGAAALEAADALAAALSMIAQAFAPDPGFPAAVAAAGIPLPILRYTIDEAPYDRRISVSGMSYFSYTQSNNWVGMGWYAGSTPFAESRFRMVAAGIGNSGPCNGYYDLDAGVSEVLELRLVRVTGTGIVSNDDATYTQASVIACRTGA